VTHSQFPWSEGVSYVFDANDKVVCREPLLPELEGRHWNDDRKLIAAVPALIEALENAKYQFEKIGRKSFWDTHEDVARIDAVLTSIGRTKS
jgi:hypothetical protein